jgi:Alcohol dehydrogenase GroES-like domain
VYLPSQRRPPAQHIHRPAKLWAPRFTRTFVWTPPVVTEETKEIAEDTGDTAIDDLVGDRRIEIYSRPIPRLRPDEVLVRVHFCALCGTDRGAFINGSNVIPGHEISGSVVECGSRVDASLKGERGVVYLVDYCGDCAACHARTTNMCLRKRRIVRIHGRRRVRGLRCGSGPVLVARLERYRAR